MRLGTRVAADRLSKVILLALMALPAFLAFGLTDLFIEKLGWTATFLAFAGIAAAYALLRWIATTQSYRASAEHKFSWLWPTKF